MAEIRNLNSWKKVPMVENLHDETCWAEKEKKFRKPMRKLKKKVNKFIFNEKEENIEYKKMPIKRNHLNISPIYFFETR